MRLLLVEDDLRLADTLRRGLEEEGYAVTVAPDAEAAQALAAAEPFDGFIVDWRLPRGDGRSFVAHLRATGHAEPVLMLTALAEVEHRVAGLDAGADDYLAKPFAFAELLARLRALLRRAARPPRFLALGALRIDGERRVAEVETDDGWTVLNLRPKELALLELFLLHPGRVLSRERIVETVWAEAPFVSDNALDVTVSGLRQRLADAPGTPVIETIRGVGYLLRG